MTKEEIAQWVIDKRYHATEYSGLSDAELYLTLIEKINTLITESISDHEAGKWMKYPENKPDHSLRYWVTIKGRKEPVEMVYDETDCFGFASNFIIAWMPYKLPAPYQEEIKSLTDVGLTPKQRKAKQTYFNQNKEDKL